MYYYNVQRGKGTFTKYVNYGENSFTPPPKKKPTKKQGHYLERIVLYKMMTWARFVIVHKDPPLASNVISERSLSGRGGGEVYMYPLPACYLKEYSPLLVSMWAADTSR